jgi:lipopolysaccharide/colanic/teichoic acid biosynthesis glycosyltransferase
MDLFIETVTLGAIFLLIYHHLIYPALLRLAQARAAPPAPVARLPSEALPKFTIVVPAFNEAAVIAGKVENIAALDYPAERLDIVIACDGCIDDTVAIARRTAACHPANTFLILDHAANRGKVAVLNEVLSLIDHGIICLTDASALLGPDALQIAAADFADPKIGVVAATYRFATEGIAGEAAYWRYQTAVKLGESALGGVIGVHGAGYFFRASLFEPLPPDTINDDFVLPMGIVARGHRALYDPRIVATELEVATPELELRRRRRIAAGNMQQLLRLGRLLLPHRGGVAFCFASGKALRVLSPFLMVLAFVGCLWLSLAGWPAFGWLLDFQVLVYAMALTKELMPQRKLPRVIELVHYLVAGHAMALVGGSRYLFGLERGRWHRVSDLPADYFLPAPTHISPATQLGKRLLDIAGALAGLALGSLLAGPIALAIKLGSRGPVIFRQLRIGRALPDRTELFVMYKFRTMYVDAEAKTGPVWATKGDPRITPVGRFLRKTRLDEIPQLVNVLRGDMSLVGPRPERPGITQNLEDAIPFFAERTFGIRPGITGLAQVNQGYDETLDDVRSKVLYDHAYGLAIMSFWSWLRTDLAVLWRTFAVIFGGRGR